MAGAAAVAVVGAVGTMIGAKSSASAASKAKKSADQSMALTQATYIANMEASAAGLYANAEAAYKSGASQASATVAQAEQERILYYQEAESARAIANQNISLMKKESVEAVRRLSATNETVEDRTSALTGASGVRMEGSAEIYYNNLVEENKNQVNWLSDSWNSKINIANKEAQSVYDLNKAKGDTAVKVAQINANSIMEIAGYTAQAYSAEAAASLAAISSVQSQYAAATAPRALSVVEKLNAQTAALARAKENSRYVPIARADDNAR